MLGLSSKGSAHALEVRVTIGKLFTFVIGGVVLAAILHYRFQYAEYANLYASSNWYMERSFVFVTIFCFAMSVHTLLATFVYKRCRRKGEGPSVPLKFFDMGYHGIATVLLFIVAILFLVSTWQIELDTRAFWWQPTTPCPPPLVCVDPSYVIGKRTWEKTIVAWLTVGNSLVCARITTLIAKNQIVCQDTCREAPTDA